ncbi:MAG TPA: hypothetical protein VH540_27825 [Ktedonobacterales bacterium]|jgi:hypothetical protein
MGEHHTHHEHRDLGVHTAPAVLDIGEDIGALVIYTGPELHGHEIEVSPRANPPKRGHGETRRTHTAVLERRVNGRSLFAALFLALQAGDYTIWAPNSNLPAAVTIIGGQVAEVDWR